MEPVPNGLHGFIISQLSVLDTLEKARKLGAITIAAHVDSTKGIYSDLNCGLARAQVFKTDNLMGMQVNNLASLPDIKSLLENREYKREKPIAFIRCSDFHNKSTDIENYVTYMKLEKMDFQSLFNAFMNPIERISFTQHPESTEIINRLIDNIYTITFKNINEDTIASICRAACALLNQGHGTIIIGVGDGKSLIGIRKDKSECKKAVANILRKLEGNKYIPEPDITTYPYGNGNILVINLNSSQNSIFSIENEVFILKDKKVVLASPYDLVKIGEERFINRFIEIQTINKKKIENIYNELEAINKFEHNLSLYNKINSNSILLTEVLDIKFVENNVDSRFDDIPLNLDEGTSDGNLFFVNGIRKPHYNDVYLRCTCRRTNSDFKIDFESDLYEDECIIIIPGGGSHLVKNAGGYRIVNSIPILMLTIKEKYRGEYCYESIIAWFKSPILLWYTSFMYDTIDIFKPEPLKNMPIIMLECMKPHKEIENIISKMINKEEDFLRQYELNNNENEDKDSKVKQTSDNAQKWDELFNNHNISVAGLALEVEEYIIENLKITDEELGLVENMLKQNDMGAVLNYSSHKHT